MNEYIQRQVIAGIADTGMAETKRTSQNRPGGRKRDSLFLEPGKTLPSHTKSMGLVISLPIAPLWISLILAGLSQG